MARLWLRLLPGLRIGNIFILILKCVKIISFSPRCFLPRACNAKFLKAQVRQILLDPAEVQANSKIKVGNVGKLHCILSCLNLLINMET